MSMEQNPTKKLTVSDIIEMKKKGQKITVTTAYDYAMATIADDAGIDVILVGGSLGMAVLGYKTTIPVTQQDIEHHLRPVARAVKRSLVVAPLSFGACQVSNEQAIENAIRLMQAGADSVKTQGAGIIIERTGAIVEANIPCMGHGGLAPQYISQVEGFKAVGKMAEDSKKIYDDCFALQEKGAWGIELECASAEVADVITRKLRIPIIGTGSGVMCDGQYLNLYDALGLLKSFKPRFAKRYINFYELGVENLKRYCSEVREGSFPTHEQSIKIPKEELKAFLKKIEK